MEGREREREREREERERKERNVTYIIVYGMINDFVSLEHSIYLICSDKLNESVSLNF